MNKQKTFSLLLVLLLSNVCWAQDPTLAVTDTKVAPAAITRGGSVLLSCRVTHESDQTLIGRVAAEVSSETINTAYPNLYDDGTNGDNVAADGVFSLRITTPKQAGEAKIVFFAVDKDNSEVESEPIVLKVE